MPAEAQVIVRELTGWGRTAPSAARYLEPADRVALLAAVQDSPLRGTVARGLGRSYGDAAQNAGGLVLGTRHLDRVVELDLAAGTVTVEAGVPVGRLARRLLAHGLFVPVTPGTGAVTVGGAIAADVHGKNHHQDGSIGRHVERMTLALADGTLQVVTPQPDGDPDLFWATLGGMGLTGIVVEATLRGLPVDTSWMSVDTCRAADLDAVLAALEDADRHRYSVAWLDGTATGGRAGRGVVTGADHAAAEQVSSWPPGGVDAPVRIRAPRWSPPRLLNRWTVAAFNKAWYRAAPAGRHGQPQTPAQFFYPLDRVAGWNRLYGSTGLVQYQCVVPDTATVAALLASLRAARAPVFLVVLKRFGSGNPGPLSFPRPGWTLAVDLPAGVDGLGALLDHLDAQVAAAGGAVYLAKDARMRPEMLPVFYPTIDRWVAVRDRVDPHRRWCSDQARRLSL